MSLDALAPDQRAVVQLVLQQGRSYADLADLLGTSEQAVRERAHRGLDRLADGGELDAAQRGDVADFLLGQQSDAGSDATRTLLTSAPAANAWATAVASELRDLRGADIPAIPERESPAEPGAEPDLEPAVRARPRPARRDRPGRERPEEAAPAAAATDAESEADATAAAQEPRTSRLGGALLLGGLAILLVAVVVWLVTRGDDSGTQSASSSPTPAATASATPTFQALGQLALSAPSGNAKGTMVLYAGTGGQLAFTLQGTSLPPNTKGDAYAVWLVGGDQPHRLGFAAAVKADGKLGVSGPREADQAQFPKWFTQAKSVVVSRETQEQSKRPGPVVLQGKIPAQAKSGSGG